MSFALLAAFSPCGGLDFSHDPHNRAPPYEMLRRSSPWIIRLQYSKSTGFDDDHRNNNYYRSNSNEAQPGDSITDSNNDNYDDANSDNNNSNDDTDGEPKITFFHDFVAGGLAGSASVVVGHPFDTVKVRVQAAASATMQGWWADVRGLFRGMGPPLSAATLINAIIFASYGAASKLYDRYVPSGNGGVAHDPWQKSVLCGSFAGLMQCFIICPMEHIKCRLQVQTSSSNVVVGNGTTTTVPHYEGSWQATRQILREHGLGRLYQGWWITFWREVPAFGLYFSTYDYVKDAVNMVLSQQATTTSATTVASDTSGLGHSHTWLASAIAGGCSGSFTWAIIYPLDVIKTRIQTAPLTTPWSDLHPWKVGREIVQQYGWRYMFRGFGVTMVRAFPVNGTIFPVYEFTLQQLRQWGA